MTPPAPPARTLATSAGLVAFHDEGEGPPVLLIHGFPTSSWQWREFIPLLAARFRVIAPDLPGSGASTAADGVKLDLAAHAAAIRELLAEISVERFAVVGHGAGAGVAQLLALDGDGVDAMVLLDAATLDAWPSPRVEAARNRLASAGASPELV
ncbi:MAG TPA: alpha/beta fold hydrolase, partial [Actinomycetota bacterium]